MRQLAGAVPHPNTKNPHELGQSRESGWSPTHAGWRPAFPSGDARSQISAAPSAPSGASRAGWRYSRFLMYYASNQSCISNTVVHMRRLGTISSISDPMRMQAALYRSLVVRQGPGTPLDDRTASKSHTVPNMDRCINSRTFPLCHGYEASNTLAPE
ncbi:hypothetical protein BC628DRAFT_463545 [Trametes gibbosa]|nr:hypothetical protein BC628DRAFT_463545 [Trametes gibbosa]